MSFHDQDFFGGLETQVSRSTDEVVSSLGGIEALLVMDGGKVDSIAEDIKLLALHHSGEASAIASVILDDYKKAQEKKKQDAAAMVSLSVEEHSIALSIIDIGEFEADNRQGVAKVTDINYNLAEIINNKAAATILKVVAEALNLNQEALVEAALDALQKNEKAALEKNEADALQKKEEEGIQQRDERVRVRLAKWSADAKIQIEEERITRFEKAEAIRAAHAPVKSTNPEKEKEESKALGEKLWATEQGMTLSKGKYFSNQYGTTGADVAVKMRKTQEFELVDYPAWLKDSDVILVSKLPNKQRKFVALL